MYIPSQQIRLLLDPQKMSARQVSPSVTFVNSLGPSRPDSARSAYDGLGTPGALALICAGHDKQVSFASMTTDEYLPGSGGAGCQLRAQIWRCERHQQKELRDALS